MAFLSTFAWGLLALIFGGYLLPHMIVTWFFKTKNLKKAYNAEWALVTGSSSGGWAWVLGRRSDSMNAAAFREPER